MNSGAGRSTQVLVLLCLFAGPSARGQVTLPRLLSDGMVLQRDAAATVWGWAQDSQRVEVRFLDSTYHAMAGTNGEWSVLLAPAHQGGPFEMRIGGLTIHDIMIGDVWVCSGQSNMELPVRRVRPVYEVEIAHARNARIRQFLVPQRYDFRGAARDLPSGGWQSADSLTVLDFSAAAYFFAKELYEKYNVPIGLINATMGGSPAEAWMSEASLKVFPAYEAEARRFRDSAVIRRIEGEDEARIRAWYGVLNRRDAGYSSLGKQWTDPSLNTSRWARMRVPGYWSGTPLGAVNGGVWFVKKFRVASSILGSPAKLILGRIVDADSAFVNGVFVGTTSYQYPPRRYDIPARLLNAGINTLVVRVISAAGRGGFVPDKPYRIEAGSASVDLRGTWRYRLGAAVEPLGSRTFIRWKPLGLYNAMIAPLLNYRVKGVIWYQGESNADRALEYRELFPALIRDWRSNWHQCDFPFLFVQLPNFMKPVSRPSWSTWALMRESQGAALSEPNTGMAVTCDIGEWNDIHPLDKKDVGIRLALAAERVAYGDQNVVSSGPLYRSMSIEGHRIRLKFSDIGSGLVVGRGGMLRYFAVAGADRRFVWARAKIAGNDVLVWNDGIPHPVAVRYGWADNPAGANLRNREGLPASPFRTDDWPEE